MLKSQNISSSKKSPFFLSQKYSGNTNEDCKIKTPYTSENISKVFLQEKKNQNTEVPISEKVAGKCYERVDSIVSPSFKSPFSNEIRVSGDGKPKISNDENKENIPQNSPEYMSNFSFGLSPKVTLKNDEFLDVVAQENDKHYCPLPPQKRNSFHTKGSFKLTEVSISEKIDLNQAVLIKNDLSTTELMKHNLKKKESSSNNIEQSTILKNNINSQSSIRLIPPKNNDSNNSYSNFSQPMIVSRDSLSQNTLAAIRNDSNSTIQISTKEEITKKSIAEIPITPKTKVKIPKNIKKLNNYEDLKKIFNSHMEVLKSGLVMLKFGRKGLFGPTKRKIIFSDQMDYFYWINPERRNSCTHFEKCLNKTKQVKIKKKFFLRDIKEIVDGRNSENFAKFKCSDEKTNNLSFSIVLNDRTVDLQAIKLSEKESFVTSLIKIMLLRKKMMLGECLGIKL